MTYSAYDLSRYIINYMLNNNRQITNLKLQKLLYYIQAAFLVERKKTIYNENILCWRHGPVVKEVYDRYKIYGSSPIRENQNILREFDLDKLVFTDTEDMVENIICVEDKFIIDKVIRSYFNYSAWDMVEKTHNEDPWIESNKKSNLTIDSELIYNYYIQNKERIYG